MTSAQSRLLDLSQSGIESTSVSYSSEGRALPNKFREAKFWKNVSLKNLAPPGLSRTLQLVSEACFIAFDMHVKSLWCMHFCISMYVVYAYRGESSTLPSVQISTGEAILCRI